jgi:A/G-specific adenine glycosylase
MESKLAAFNSLLLKWYFDKDKRSFPWRKSKDPYQVLIAEIMLQRTKAEQVVPVFLSFIERFPSPKELSKAKKSEIESYFAKLGLMWRALKVKLLSEKLVKDFNGMVPRERSQLMSLPGVGDYVADAVLCFAFDEDVAIIDSNVCRVIGRVFGLEPKSEARKDPLYREIAKRLAPSGKCREYNWAIIDHAATICTPKNPKCGICPLNIICNYYVSVILKHNASAY